jgi:DNA-binding CsgD family transcriptional regulator
MATAYRARAIKEHLRASRNAALDLSGNCRNPKKSIDVIDRMEPDRPQEIDSSVQPWPGTGSTHMLMAGLEALNFLGIGLIVCNVFGQLLLANQTAEEFLTARDGLALNSDRVLCAVRPCRPSVEEVVQRAASAVLDKEVGSKDAALSVLRPSNKRALTVLVRSVTSASKAVNSAQPAALVLILDTALPVQTIAVELQQLYGFTSTEARLANLLMEGAALDDCCEQLGICRSTGCTHLKRIFKKTGVSRQSELVTLLLKSIGLARLGNVGTAVRSLIRPSSKQTLHKDIRPASRATSAL